MWIIAVTPVCVNACVRIFLLLLSFFDSIFILVSAWKQKWDFSIGSYRGVSHKMQICGRSEFDWFSIDLLNLTLFIWICSIIETFYYNLTIRFISIEYDISNTVVFLKKENQVKRNSVFPRKFVWNASPPRIYRVLSRI